MASSEAPKQRLRRLRSSSAFGPVDPWSPVMLGAKRPEPSQVSWERHAVAGQHLRPPEALMHDDGWVMVKIFDVFFCVAQVVW